MSYVRELRKLVGNRSLLLPGAVAIILNDLNEVLLQHRTDGGWGVPGGLTPSYRRYMEPYLSGVGVQG